MYAQANNNSLPPNLELGMGPVPLTPILTPNLIHSFQWLRLQKKTLPSISPPHPIPPPSPFSPQVLNTPPNPQNKLRPAPNYSATHIRQSIFRLPIFQHLILDNDVDFAKKQKLRCRIA